MGVWSVDQFPDEDGEFFFGYFAIFVGVDVAAELPHLSLGRHDVDEPFFIDFLEHIPQFSAFKGAAFVDVEFDEDSVDHSGDPLHFLFADSSCDVVDSKFLPDHLVGVLGLVGQLVLLVLLGDVEGRLVLKGLVGLQGLKVVGGVFDDVGGLVAQDFPGEVFEDGREVLGNRVFLDVPARHSVILLIQSY